METSPASRLRELGLLSPGRGGASEGLLALCNAGALDGGLSVAPDLRPDELLGPLCARLGGRAARVKVLDVREKPKPRLQLAFAGDEVTWAVPGLEELVARLNRFFSKDAAVRAIAWLGESDEMLQLWCVEKRLVPTLLREPWFAPANRAALEPLGGRPGC